MSITDVEFQKLNLRCVHEFSHFLGDYFFDAITYLIQYKESSLFICQNVIAHMQHCSLLGTFETLLCKSCEL
jgi:hypothetical protein